MHAQLLASRTKCIQLVNSDKMPLKAWGRRRTS